MSSVWYIHVLKSETLIREPLTAAVETIHLHLGSYFQRAESPLAWSYYQALAVLFVQGTDELEPFGALKDPVALALLPVTASMRENMKLQHSPRTADDSEILYTTSIHTLYCHLVIELSTVVFAAAVHEDTCQPRP